MQEKFDDLKKDKQMLIKFFKSDYITKLNKLQDILINDNNSQHFVVFSGDLNSTNNLQKFQHFREIARSSDNFLNQKFWITDDPSFVSNHFSKQSVNKGDLFLVQRRQPY